MTDRTNTYDFVQLGEGLADHLIHAAEEQVSKAQLILDQTVSLADIIRTQVKAQAEQIEDMNARFRAFGEQMLAAHRQLEDAPAAAGLDSPAAGAAGDDRAAQPAGRGATTAAPADRRHPEGTAARHVPRQVAAGAQPAHGAGDHGSTGTRPNGSGL